MAEELKAEHAPGLEIALKAMLKHRVAKGGVHLDALALLEGMIEEARAQLHSQGGEAVAWREHSVNYAKGEKCPETIETLQAAWDRDQELINDMRHEIARHKTRINRLEQRRRPADQVEDDLNMVKVSRELLQDLRDLAFDQVEHHRAAMGAYKQTRQSAMDSVLAQADALLRT